MCTKAVRTASPPSGEQLWAEPPGALHITFVIASEVRPDLDHGEYLFFRPARKQHGPHARAMPYPSRMTPLVRALRALLRAAATVLIVPFLLFEEWGWEPLAALAARLSRLPLWARMEDRLRRLPPWGALLAFFVPVLLLLPVKVLALFLFSHGHAGSGVTVLVLAKLAGTAIVARIFQLVEGPLMRIPWFARWYPRWKAWKDHVLNLVRQSRPWRVVRALNRRLARGWRRLREG